jgi:hypothetical protein
MYRSILNPRIAAVSILALFLSACGSKPSSVHCLIEEQLFTTGNLRVNVAQILAANGDKAWTLVFDQSSGKFIISGVPNGVAVNDTTDFAAQQLAKTDPTTGLKVIESLEIVVEEGNGIVAFAVDATQSNGGVPLTVLKCAD